MNGTESFDAYKVRLNDFIAKMSAEQIKGWTQSHRHFILQKNMFYVGRKCYADLILKLEELEQAPAVLSVFSEQLSKVSEMWVKRKNERKKDGVDLRIENVLTKDSFRKVEQLYSEDFALFGYEKYGNV